MSFEEHIEYHEQRLRAMESNQLQMSEHLASVDRRLDRFAELIVTAAQTRAGSCRAKLERKRTWKH